MKGFFEKLLSWSPLLMLLLLFFSAWTFLRNESPRPLALEPFCKTESLLEIEQDPFLVVYRKEGCGKIAEEQKSTVIKNIFWWEEASQPLNFPALRQGTRINIRPGPLLVRSKLGSPGIVSLPPLDDGPPSRYTLAKGLNLLVLKEALPGWKSATLQLAAGSLALHFLGQESYRVVASPAERKINLQKNWPQSLLQCSRLCSPADLLQD